ncbi:MAG TPA: class I SAM-dependent methyltransferase [Chloroflexota bacterium]|nr:class I SAM-dependent methyltransferase [Chloroflexota bacterium]
MALTQQPPPMTWGTAPELVGPRHAYRIRRLARCLRSAMPAGTILDAGCGAGGLTELLARMGYSVTAIDESPEFVAYTRARMDYLGLAHRVHVFQADLPRASLRPHWFDGAVCGEVLEHLDDDDAAVRAIAAALRPGGILALTVPAGSDRFGWLDTWAGHRRRYEAADLRRLIEGNGLRIDLMVRWGFPFMMLYERFLQGPGLARAGSPGGERSLLAKIARGRATTALAGLFHLDEPFDRLSRGTGFLVRARKT